MLNLKSMTQMSAMMMLVMSGSASAAHPPLTSNLLILGISESGRSEIESTGGSLSLERGDSITLRGQALEFDGHPGRLVRIQGSLLSGRNNISLQNFNDGTVEIHALSSTENYPAEMLLESRALGGSPVRLRLHVTRPQFRGFTHESARESVAQAYRAILDRDPDEGGMQGYVENLIRNGLHGWEDTLVALARSAEFQAVRARSSDDQILSNLYNGLLRRNPDPASYGWLKVIRSGRIGEAAKGIGTSEEFLDRLIENEGSHSRRGRRERR